MKRLDEKEIIGIFSRALGVGDLDDVAQIGSNMVFKADMLVASTDVPMQMTPRQVARKSVVSCASDLAAKGARPVAAMISLGLPADITRGYVEELAAGFRQASQEFAVKIVGGDTNAAKELVIDCSMVGVASKVPKRSGARPGDVVIASGRFGYSASGLAVLLKGARAQGTFRKLAVDSVLEPAPRQAFGSLARHFTSSIDSSDGLAISLYEIAVQSRVDIDVDYDSVKAEGVEEFAQANGLDAHELVFHGGEEYEIIATVPKSLLPKAKAAAKKADCSIHVIGSVKKGTGKVTANKKPVENRGYLHFS
jgi:thiamine-monophosphate kinase